jgi:hypothetical protein
VNDFLRSDFISLVPFCLLVVLSLHRRGLEADAVVENLAHVRDALYHRPFEWLADVLLKVLDMVVVYMAMILPDQLAFFLNQLNK